LIIQALPQLAEGLRSDELYHAISGGLFMTVSVPLTPLLLALPLLVTATAATALDDTKMRGQLLRLDPQTRLEQTCDAEVMFKINREQPPYQVDKVIAYTFKDTILGENSIKAPGAVFRSRGDWYRLAYECVTGPHHLDAHSLSYKIGKKVARAAWERYYLYN
jgi:hypothetical protein